jgi:hypothetical protein
VPVDVEDRDAAVGPLIQYVDKLTVLRDRDRASSIGWLLVG